jgi:hypothetical protein
MRNRIINGAMVIDQRNAGAAIATGQGYAVDRWQADSTQASKISIQQNNGSVTPPAGFVNYWGANVTNAYSVTSSDTFYFRQMIEGLNVSDLAWGTANAKTVTLSFWIRSSLTGTFGGAIKNSANNRSYPFTYTINAANTWEYETITIAGDTSGTWLTTNGTGVRVVFNQGVGSSLLGTAGAWAGANYDGATGQVNLVATSGATWYITGVQLEVGTQATSFEYRQYGTELALCQRYYFKVFPNATTKALTGTGLAYSTTEAIGIQPLPPQLRVAPTALETTGVATDYSISIFGTTSQTCSAVPTFNGIGTINSALVAGTVASGLTTGYPTFFRSLTANAFFAWSAEL